MSLCIFRFSWKTSSLEGNNFYIYYLDLLSTTYVKCTLFFNPVPSTPVQPAVQMKDPVSKKAVEMKATQTSRSGKFVKQI